MVVVKTVEEFKEKNDEEMRAFMMYQTGIYDPEIINDTMGDFYLRLLQTRYLEEYDENRATTEKGNILNYERWVCNNFCWLLPLLRKKNYSSVLKLRLSKKEAEERAKRYGVPEGDAEFETLRFFSTLPTRDNTLKEPVDIYDVVNLNAEDSGFSVDSRFRVSMVESHEVEELRETINSFFCHTKKVLPKKKSDQINQYMKYRSEGLNSVDIGILMDISNNMVKIIKKEAQETYKRWMKSHVEI